MADGSSRRQDNLEIGDYIAGFDPSGVVARDQIVVKIIRAMSMMVEVTHTQGTIACSLSHVFIAPDGSEFKADEIVIGLHQFTSSSGNPIDILAVIGIPDAIVIGIEVTPDANFVAEGIRHHNKTMIA